MSLDLHSLNLIRLVAKHRCFSDAAKEASISPSALSRQVSNAENKLGVLLFHRSTRKVTITEAGAILLRETAPIPNLIEKALRRLSEECLNAPAQIKVGISPDLSLAHIPGIIGKNIQGAQIRVTQVNHQDLLERLGESLFDLGIFTMTEPLPAELVVTHTMTDQFVLITGSKIVSPAELTQLPDDEWILPLSGTPPRILIDRALPGIKPAMEIDQFDLMIQLVASGLGQAIVPRRSLSTFHRRRGIQRHALPMVIERTLVVAVPKLLRPSESVGAFIRNILFS